MSNDDSKYLPVDFPAWNSIFAFHIPPPSISSYISLFITRQFPREIPPTPLNLSSYFSLRPFLRFSVAFFVILISTRALNIHEYIFTNVIIGYIYHTVSYTDPKIRVKILRFTIVTSLYFTALKTFCSIINYE